MGVPCAPLRVVGVLPTPQQLTEGGGRMATPQAPARDRKRSTVPAAGKGTPVTDKVPKGTGRDATTQGEKPIEKGAKQPPQQPKQEQPKAAAPVKPPEPKTYVYGGAVGKPQPGANSRRLWKFLTGKLTKADLGRVKDELARIQQKEHPDDRFVRWQRIVAACDTLGIKYKEQQGDKTVEKPVNQALVRSLQVADKGGVIGKDVTITIF